MDAEAEYNNRARLPSHVDVLARWQAASAAHREAAHAALDQPYGPDERQRYDLFHAAAADAPLVVYFHGGYWQMGRREATAFVAPALTAAGVELAIPSYRLCPAVGVLDAIDDARRCALALWRRTGKRIVAAGHSAGGHLAAALLATDWQRHGAPADLVPAALAISGVFDLAPLIATTMNAALGLDPDRARAASPLCWPPPTRGALVTAVGGEETGEFHRQSHTLRAAWRALATDHLVVRDADHFTIVNELTRPDSALFRRTVALAGIDLA